MDVKPINWPKKVSIVEVGPRDGLQNEKEKVPFQAKITFIEKLIEAGVQSVEVGSFVRPDRVPQMADSEQVVRHFTAKNLQKKVTMTALVPNSKGLTRALECGVERIALFTAASEAFTAANIGMTVADSLKGFSALAKSAASEGLGLRGYLSTAWYCPYAGKVKSDDVVDIAKRLLDLGCEEISVADTVGAVVPGEVEETLVKLLKDIPARYLAVHFHDTRGTALANVIASLNMGIETVDASSGGLGGCPYAPGARGNLATEDLVFMLGSMGIETGIDLRKLREASSFMEDALGRTLPSNVLRAGPFVAKGTI